MFGDTGSPSAPHPISDLSTVQVLSVFDDAAEPETLRLRAYSRYQTEPLGKPTLIERFAYFIPRYATESLVKGRNAQEQRRIRHRVGEVNLSLKDNIDAVA